MPLDTSSSQIERIAILGGGLGSLITALELTGQEKNRGRYEVTIYHNGWRLGGKGASGRNAQFHERIEEHGLHVWLGFYQNAFELIRAAMAEWRIPPDHPWEAATPGQRWENAFKPHSFAPLTEKRNGVWEVWPVQFPEKLDGHTPGDSSPSPFDDFWGLVRLLVKSLLHLGSIDPVELGGTGKPLIQVHSEHVHRARPYADKLRRWLVPSGKSGCLGFISRMFSDSDASLSDLVGLAKVMKELVLEDLLKSPVDSLRRLGLILHVGWALVTGLLSESDAIAKGTLDVLDDVELRDFLRSHGATPAAVDCPLVTAIYAAIFAYQGGDTTRQSLAAGAGIRCLMRIFLGYKRALAWKMQAGMGDTVFTPLYQVLQARGVKFRYFHRVKNLELSADRTRIARVVVGRQVTLRDGVSDYAPLRNVKGLDCWPSEPLWEQIDGQEARDIRQLGVNLEHSYSESLWPDREVLTLEDGRDFDRVVLGISIGALPLIGSELIAASGKFSAMVQGVQTTRTQAYQAWLLKDLAGLGWTLASPILSCYLDPLNTWADMSHLLKREDLDGSGVQSLSYFCGPMSDQVPVALADQHIRQNADAVLDELSGSLWPRTSVSGRFDKSLLAMEYLRTNTNPSDRYVLTLPGSTKLRIHPDDSGFENLVLAGDWTRNGLNVGCVEATVMSGRLASRAVSGFPTLDQIAGAKGP